MLIVGFAVVGFAGVAFAVIGLVAAVNVIQSNYDDFRRD